MNKIQSYRLPRARAAQGQMQLPGSKSISNRALLLAAMAQGRTELHGVLESDDTEVMLDSLQRLGVSARRLESSVYEVIGGWDTLNPQADRSEEHTSELQSRGHLVCRLLLEKKKSKTHQDNAYRTDD